jgi:hypothetical protein
MVAFPHSRPTRRVWYALEDSSSFFICGRSCSNGSCRSHSCSLRRSGLRRVHSSGEAPPICEDIHLPKTDSHSSNIQRPVVCLDGDTVEINIAYLGCVVDTRRTGFAEARVCICIPLSLKLGTDFKTTDEQVSRGNHGGLAPGTSSYRTGLRG